jgi:hypothetical protein
MIEFHGMDIIVQHRMDAAQVRRALAEVLHVPEERVALIDDMDQYPNVADAHVVCMSSRVEGEFAYLLSIQVNRVTLPYETRAQLMQLLSERLGAEYITPDEEDVDPYVMWHVTPGGMPGRVGLDPVAFDEDRYVIARNV